MRAGFLLGTVLLSGNRQCDKGKRESRFRAFPLPSVFSLLRKRRLSPLFVGVAEVDGGSSDGQVDQLLLPVIAQAVDFPLYKAHHVACLLKVLCPVCQEQGAGAFGGHTKSAPRLHGDGGAGERRGPHAVTRSLEEFSGFRSWQETTPGLERDTMVPDGINSIGGSS